VFYLFDLVRYRDFDFLGTTGHRNVVCWDMVKSAARVI